MEQYIIISQIEIPNKPLLAESGLVMTYEYRGNTYHVCAVPEQAAELLKLAGYIDDYQVHDGLLVLQFFHEDEHAGYPARGETNCEWSVYVQENHFSWHEARIVATALEMQKLEERDKKEAAARRRLDGAIILNQALNAQ